MLWISGSKFRRIAAGIQNGVRSFPLLPASFVRICAVVSHGLLTLWRQMKKRSSNEIRCLKNFEITFGVVMALGALDDGFTAGVPGDFLEGEGMTEEVFGESLAPGVVIGGDEVITTVMDVKSGMFPTE